MAGTLRAIIRLPVDDYLAALARFAAGWDWRRLAVLLGALVLTWWMYVPLHELAHAYGCILGGGTVTRLDIDAVYGAAPLQRVFSFVHVGSEYAGQLSGFDTHGSDAVYLLTDFLPFLATIAIGVPLLRAAGAPGQPAFRQAVLFGAALPIAFAPFISITGDYYEMGSILVSRAVAALSPGFDPARWRSDDLFRLLDRVFGNGGGNAADAAGIAASVIVGGMLAVATYAAGAMTATAMHLGMDRTPDR